MPDFTNQRQQMVQEQIKRRGISSPKTLESMLKVPRHAFVPPSLIQDAYADCPLPIGEGQTISQPYIVALMTEAAKLTSNSRVLEIGTGSGYAAAILSQIAEHVFTIERIPKLADAAIKKFQELGYSNIEVKCGDGTLGWAENGPYDAIIVTAGAPIVPSSLKAQLKEGGVLLFPLEIP